MNRVWAGVSVNSRSTPRLSASAGCRPGILKVSTVTYADFFFILSVIYSVIRIPLRNKGCWLMCFTDSHYSVLGKKKEKDSPPFAATASDWCWRVGEIQQGIAPWFQNSESCFVFMQKLRFSPYFFGTFKVHAAKPRNDTAESATGQTKSTSLCICFLCRAGWWT